MRKSAEDRWWDTYNAALGGCLAWSTICAGEPQWNSPEEAESLAKESADRVHPAFARERDAAAKKADEADEEERKLDAEMALEKLMGSLSEQMFSAGWHHGIEFHLWDVMHGEVSDARVSRVEIDRLFDLSDCCGGWFVWSDEEGCPMWIALDDMRAERDRHGQWDPENPITVKP